MQQIYSDPLAWLVILSVGGLAIVGIAAIALYVADLLYGPEEITTPAWERRPFPQRYPGCVTCEAAEAAGRSSMVRHQERDHTDGVRW